MIRKSDHTGNDTHAKDASTVAPPLLGPNVWLFNAGVDVESAKKSVANRATVLAFPNATK